MCKGNTHNAAEALRGSIPRVLRSGNCLKKSASQLSFLMYQNLEVLVLEFDIVKNQRMSWGVGE